jgi:hypothetical protein
MAYGRRHTVDGICNTVYGEALAVHVIVILVSHGLRPYSVCRLPYDLGETNMEDRRGRHFVDDLLDAGLAQYRGVEPRPGLENRILAQLRGEQKASPSLVWAWRIGAGLAAAAVTVALLSTAYRGRRHVPVPVTEHVPVPVTESVRPAPALASADGGAARAMGRQSPTPRYNTGNTDQTGSADLSSRSAAFGSALPHPLVGRNGVRPVASAARLYGEARTAEAARGLALADSPRRDVFPSPSPLSEEEKLLVSYVRHRPCGALAAFSEDDQPVASLRVPDLNIPPLETEGAPGRTTGQTK